MSTAIEAWLFEAGLAPGPGCFQPYRNVGSAFGCLRLEALQLPISFGPPQAISAGERFLQAFAGPETAADGCFALKADVTLRGRATQEGCEVGLWIWIAASPVEHHSFEGSLAELAIDRGRLHTIELKNEAVLQIPLDLRLPGEGQQLVGRDIGAEGEWNPCLLYTSDAADE